MLHFLFRGFLEEDEHIKKIFRRPLVFAMRPFMLWAIVWTVVTVALWFFYPTYNLESKASFDLNLIWQLSALTPLKTPNKVG